MQIADKMFVAIDYRLTLDSGEEIDKSEANEPLGFITGASQVIPGLEKALMGKAAGYEAKIVLEPEEAYGAVREDLFQEVPKDRFPDDTDIEPGMTFQAQGPQGPFMITVASLNANDTVTVDLNHPMAGKRLQFDVKVVEVRQPTADEIAELSAPGGCGCGCGSAPADNACGCGPSEQSNCGCGGSCG